MTHRLETSRRAVLLSGTAVGIVALTACSSDEPEAETETEPQAGSSDGTLVAVDEVPVGGAVSVDGPDGPLLVSQPTEGDIVAFSAICTHMGCTVKPDGEQFRCPCHGSVYDAATGKNVDGPAPRPLEKVAVEVVDGQVRTA